MILQVRSCLIVTLCGCMCANRGMFCFLNNAECYQWQKATAFSRGLYTHFTVFTQTNASIYGLNAVLETLFILVKSQNKMQTNVSPPLLKSLINIFDFNEEKINKLYDGRSKPRTSGMLSKKSPTRPLGHTNI